MQFFKNNESKLQQYSTLNGFEEAEKFLLDYPFLCSEFATSWITIEALNLSMEEKFDEMKVYARNCITLQYLLELAKSLNSLATNTNVIKTFFKK